MYDATRGGARGVPGGATSPPKFCLALPVAPQNFPRDVMPLHWSPTQTIDSSPCCKTGPSSGPPKWKCLAPPLDATAQQHQVDVAYQRELKNMRCRNVAHVSQLGTLLGRFSKKEHLFREYVHVHSRSAFTHVLHEISKYKIVLLK